MAHRYNESIYEENKQQKEGNSAGCGGLCQPTIYKSGASGYENASKPDSAVPASILKNRRNSIPVGQIQGPRSGQRIETPTSGGFAQRNTKGHIQQFRIRAEPTARVCGRTNTNSRAPGSRPALRKSERLVKFVVLTNRAIFEETKNMNEVIEKATQMINSSPPGDLDQYLCTINGVDFFMLYNANNSLPVSISLTRLAFGHNLFVVPPIDGYIDIKKRPEDLYNYFSRLPTNGILYAMQHGRYVSLTRQKLIKAWPNLFRYKKHHQKLVRRYSNALQPLIELHTGARVLEKIQQKLYKRVTAHTYELVARIMLFCSLTLKNQQFSKHAPLRFR